MMAAAPLQGLGEEATCSVCLEYFEDPVIAECGHNFCRDCLAQCWEGSEEEEVSCPQCRERVRRSIIIPNRQLANVVELTKKLRLQEEERRTIEEKRGVCGKHREPLKLFCKQDESPICVVCDRSKEHRDHHVVPLEEAAQDYKDLIGRHLALLEEERIKSIACKAETEEQSQKLLKQTKAQMEKTKEQFKELHAILNRQEKLLLSHLKEMEKEIAMRTEEPLARLLKKLSSLGGLIQEMEEKCQQPPSELLQDVRNLLQRSEKKELFQKPLALPPHLSWTCWDVCDRNAFLLKRMKQFQDAMLFGFEIQKDTLLQASPNFSPPDVLDHNSHSPLPLEIQAWNFGSCGPKHQEGRSLDMAALLGSEIQKANVTLDPETASGCLILSEDCKSARNDGRSHDVSNNPERFDTMPFVLGREGFRGGRHFWEVAVGEKGFWAVGVAKKSVQRKGYVEPSTEKGIWALRKLRGGYRASNLPKKSFLLLSEKLMKIRVSLNNERGLVVFHDAHTESHLYTISGASFSGETIMPFFGVWQKASLAVLPTLSVTDLIRPFPLEEDSCP